MKIPDSHKSITEIAAAAKAAGMTYGKYVAMQNEKDAPPRDKPERKKGAENESSCLLQRRA
jgi:hypothetical protein